MNSLIAMNNTKIRKTISDCVLFRQLPTAQLDELLQQSRLISLDEGAFLFQQGEQADAFFLLLEGELKLATTSPSGQEKILHIVHPYQTFAEALIFLKAPTYPANVMALAPSKVVSFPSANYKHLLSGSVDACFSVLGSYSTRIRSLIDEIEVLTLHNATFRVVHYLLRETPSHQHNAVSVKLSTPKKAIASRLAITPETLSRILAKLKRDQIISVSDKQIELLNIDWMRKFVASS